MPANDGLEPFSIQMSSVAMHLRFVEQRKGHWSTLTRSSL
jgi:hypothetical protein